jgi:hypothetical protein
MIVGVAKLHVHVCMSGGLVGCRRLDDCTLLMCRISGVLNINILHRLFSSVWTSG